MFYKGIAYKEGEGVTFWGGEKRADKMFNYFSKNHRTSKVPCGAFRGFSKRLPGKDPEWRQSAPVLPSFLLPGRLIQGRD